MIYLPSIILLGGRSVCNGLKRLAATLKKRTNSRHGSHLKRLRASVAIGRLQFGQCGCIGELNVGSSVKFRRDLPSVRLKRFASAVMLPGRLAPNIRVAAQLEADWFPTTAKLICWFFEEFPGSFGCPFCKAIAT